MWIKKRTISSQENAFENVVYKMGLVSLSLSEVKPVSP